MLQQTQVKTVIPFYERWMKELPSIAALATASSEKIHKLWEGLGYYTRVRNMQKAAQVIIEKHDGQFPHHFNDVLALPGIGRYTAGAICSIAFNQPTPILDGNVIRVLTRVFGVRENPREKLASARLWKLAEELVTAAQSANGVQSSQIPQRLLAGSCSALNQALMELGALVCLPQKPQCGICPLSKRCYARQNRATEKLPNLGQRAAATARRFVACILDRNGELLIRQRPPGVVNAHLWEFPNVEVPLDASPQLIHTELEKELGALPTLVPLATIKHSITRYRISLEVFRAEMDGASTAGERGNWLALHACRRLPFTSAHRRVLNALASLDAARHRTPRQPRLADKAPDFLPIAVT